MKVSNETKVGALAAIVITILILGYNFIKGNNLFSDKTKIIAVYNRVNGLTQSDPVLVNGFKVGKVNDIILSQGKSGNIIVQLEVENKVTIPKDSKATIVNADLLGEKAVELKLGKASTPVANGDTITSNVQPGLQARITKQLFPIRNKLESVFASVDSVIKVVQFFLNKETKDNIDNSLQNMQRTLTSYNRVVKKLETVIEDNSETIDSLLYNVNHITKNIKEDDEKIDNILTNFSQFSDTLKESNLKQTLATTERSLNSFNQTLEEVNQGKGSIGKLLKEPGLYNNMDSATYNLNRLIEDIERNPGRYINLSVFNFGSGKRK